MTVLLPLRILEIPAWLPTLQTLLSTRLAPYPAPSGTAYAVGTTVVCKAKKLPNLQHVQLHHQRIWRIPFDSATPSDSHGISLHHTDSAVHDRLATLLLHITQPQNCAPLLAIQRAIGRPAADILYDILILTDGVLALRNWIDELYVELAKRQATRLDTQALATTVFAFFPAQASHHARLRFANSANALINHWLEERRRTTPRYNSTILESMRVALHF